MAEDPTYQPKVHMEQGGDVMAVKNGGEIKVHSGGKITNDGTQASAVASLTDGTTGSANDALVEITASGDDAKINDNFADLAAKVNAILAALRGAGIIGS